MGLLSEASELLDPSETMIPAVAQGIIAVEIRSDDTGLAALLAALDDPQARIVATAERAFLAEIGGGCQVPLAAYAQIEGDQLALTGLIGALDGRAIHATRYGSLSNPAELGTALARSLLAEGGDELLATLRSPAK
jgi:hydroxymethylbilane synthase